ncbi:MAG: NAD(P)-dependent oxidoreductase [Betaproteobacteria bacterium]|nr:NAD(P)-dependent oxidoreductase [Betaproteobacteria bacterium]
MAGLSVGVIGIGRMGSPFARNLLQAGHRVRVCNRHPGDAADLIAAGAVWSATPAEVAAQCEILITALPRSEIVEQAIIGPDGALAALSPGAVVIDMSTTLPKTTKAIAEALARKGVDFLDAPVSGHAAGARNATLTIMVGGSKDVFLKVREPIFEKLGKNIFHAGPTGAGQALKLVNNLLYNLNRLAMCEGLVLGAKAGIDPEVMCQAIALSTGGSHALRSLPPEILKGNFEGTESNLNLACKTLKLITDYADELNVDLLLGNLAKQIYNVMRHQGHGEESPSTLIQFYESAAGVKVRKP